MTKESCPAVGGSGGEKEKVSECKTPISSGTSSFINYQNFHARRVYKFVCSRPGVLQSEICDAFGYGRGQSDNWKRRVQISHCLEVLVFFKILRKGDGQRYYLGEKTPTLDNEPPRVFGSDGLPRIKSQTRQATIPAYAHPEASGGDGE